MGRGIAAWTPERRQAQRDRLAKQRAQGSFEQKRLAGRERMEANPAIVTKRREVGRAAARKLNTSPEVVARKIVAVTATLNRLNSSTEFRVRSAQRCRKLLNRRKKIAVESAVGVCDVAPLFTHASLTENSSDD